MATPALVNQRQNMASTTKSLVAKVISALAIVLLSIIAVALTYTGNIDTPSSARTIPADLHITNPNLTKPSHSLTYQPLRLIWSKYKVVVVSAVLFASFIVALTVFLVLYVGSSSTGDVVVVVDDVDDPLVEETKSSFISQWGAVGGVLVAFALVTLFAVYTVRRRMKAGEVGRKREFVDKAGRMMEDGLDVFLTDQGVHTDPNDVIVPTPKPSKDAPIPIPLDNSIPLDESLQRRLESINKRWDTLLAVPQKARLVDHFRQHFAHLCLTPNVITIDDKGEMHVVKGSREANVLGNENEVLMSLDSLMRGDNVVYLREARDDPNLPLAEHVHYVQVSREDCAKLLMANKSRVEYLLLQCMKWYSFWELTVHAADLMQMLPHKRLRNSAAKDPKKLTVLDIYEREMADLIAQGQLIPMIYIFDDDMSPLAIMDPESPKSVTPFTLPLKIDDQNVEALNTAILFTRLRHARLYSAYVKSLPDY